MVADFLPKNTPRSLVRVPGSGHGPGACAPAVSCDLGRVSSFAASVIVGPHLPTITMGPKVTAVPSTNMTATNKLATTEVLAAQVGSSTNSAHRRPLSLETRDDTSPATKRPRLVASSPRVARVYIHSNQGPAAIVGAVTGTSQEGRVSTVARRVVVARRTRPQQQDVMRSCQELLQERSRLQEETRVLMERLSYFIQLNQARGTQTSRPLAGPV